MQASSRPVSRSPPWPAAGPVPQPHLKYSRPVAVVVVVVDARCSEKERERVMLQAHVWEQDASSGCDRMAAVSAAAEAMLLERIR